MPSHYADLYEKEAQINYQQKMKRKNAEELNKMADKSTEQPTLRDQFAMAALPFISQRTGYDFDLDYVAQECFKMADVMLKARGQ